MIVDAVRFPPKDALKGRLGGCGITLGTARCGFRTQFVDRLLCQKRKNFVNP